LSDDAIFKQFCDNFWHDLLNADRRALYKNLRPHRHKPLSLLDNSCRAAKSPAFAGSSETFF
jgi:hypothetical protein